MKVFKLALKILIAIPILALLTAVWLIGWHDIQTGTFQNKIANAFGIDPNVVLICLLVIIIVLWAPFHFNVIHPYIIHKLGVTKDDE